METVFIFETAERLKYAEFPEVKEKYDFRVGSQFKNPSINTNF